ncbi:hypothetical protein CDD82_3806 [Ophiocordyceps australis]|uniref:Protein FYV10 n=1 Tax=Ophiocordyceps australis TaxID=1399860 RepID=A0A2C5ZV24_9HYPO|nr:hypothetical protein CDD82_3806 [Ophiocordyceps australis]
MGDHELSVLKHSEHLLLDQAALRLPSELLRKTFRSAHLAIEKDTSALKTLLKETGTAAVSGRASQGDVLRNMDAMLSRIRGVKRKLTASAQEEARLHLDTAARIQHLDDLYASRTIDDVKYEAWSRIRLDRLIVDYLLRRGFHRTARELAMERGIGRLVDVDTFTSMNRIREALLNGSVSEALAWCADNKKELRKMESKLEFMLRLQQFIELVRTQSEPKMLEAISHAKKHLIGSETAFPREIRQAAALLATVPGTGGNDSLYRRSRWADLADMFTEAHSTLLALPPWPLLYLALSSGLSALKTPACHSQSAQKGEAPSMLGHGVCPICSPELHDLARSVPYAHHNKSHVAYDLQLLPNGRAYGLKQLKSQALRLPSGMVQDPHTGQRYNTTQLKKVYIT